MDFRGIAGHVMPVCDLLLGQTRRCCHVLQTTWNLWKVVIVAFLVSRRAIGMPGVLEYNLSWSSISGIYFVKGSLPWRVEFVRSRVSC